MCRIIHWGVVGTGREIIEPEETTGRGAPWRDFWLTARESEDRPRPPTHRRGNYASLPPPLDSVPPSPSPLLPLPLATRPTRPRWAVRRAGGRPARARGRTAATPRRRVAPSLIPPPPPIGRLGAAAATTAAAADAATAAAVAAAVRTPVGARGRMAAGSGWRAVGDPPRPTRASAAATRQIRLADAARGGRGPARSLRWYDRRSPTRGTGSF